MAISEAKRTGDILHPKFARISAWESMAASIVLMVLLAFYAAGANLESVASTSLLAAGLGLLAISTIVGFNLWWRRQAWAQKFLLTFWIALGCSGLVVLLAGVLKATPDWWDEKLPMAWTGLGILVVGAASALLVHLATSDGTRQRYASSVGLTVGAAIALLLVANLIAQTEYYRANVEAFGQFRLSERTRRILDNVETPVEATVVYTATDPARPGSHFRPRTLELLREMEEHNDNLSVSSVTSDAEKDRVLALLSAQREQRYASHVAFLKSFRSSVSRIGDLALQEAQPVLTLDPNEAYLYEWNLPLGLDTAIREMREQLNETETAIRRQQAEANPDYRQLAADANDALLRARESLAEEIQRIARPLGLAAEVRQNTPAVLERYDQANQALTAFTKALGEPNDPLPEDPAGFLKSVSVDANEAGMALGRATRALRAVAGDDGLELLQSSYSWQTRFPEVNALGMYTGRRLSVDRLSTQFTQALMSLAADRAYLAETRNKEQLQQVIGFTRQNWPQSAPMFRSLKDMAAEALEGVSNVDEASQTLMQQAGEGKLMPQTIQAINDLLNAHAALPAVEESDFADELENENIIILQAAGKTRVLEFDEVWPLRSRNPGEQANDDRQIEDRTFNGDSVISSEILSMTHKPFGTVILTYFEPQIPPQMARYVQLPPPDIGLSDVTVLRERLEAANFRVVEWNLRDPMPEEVSAPAESDPNAAPPTPADASRRVLVVLPPMPNELLGPQMAQMQGIAFGPEHQARLAEAIDSGIGAVFLTHYSHRRYREVYPGMPPMPVQPRYALGEYLTNEWGIELQEDFFVVNAVSDPRLPGQYRINLSKIYYAKFNAYTDHPIGEPLQGRRTYWQAVCPLRTTPDQPLGQDANGITIEPVLTIPESWDHVWATPSMMRLQQQFESEGSYVSPDPEQGDLLPPMHLVLAATRTGQGDRGKKDTRIVVTSTGLGLVDSYLTSKVDEVDETGSSRLTDPPHANAELVVNSVYWVTAWEQYIAAGPVKVQPIDRIAPSTYRVLWILCVMGLPATILVLGGVVLLVRQR